MIITFLTDFGVSESYVGVMKGVALGICPQAQLIDITHVVPAQDRLAGALLIPEYLPYFPPGSVHVAVVDPGVGSERRGLAVELELESGLRYLVGPDNGLFWPILVQARAYRAVALAEPRFWLPQVSSTFHGRDIFTPVAAHLANGVALAEFGPPVVDLARLELPALRRAEGSVAGIIIVIDHFGNCISNIPAAELHALGEPGALRVRVGDHEIQGVQRTFADAAPGSPLALISSSGRLEIAVRDGNAARALGVTRGTEVMVWS